MKYLKSFAGQFLSAVLQMLLILIHSKLFGAEIYGVVWLYIGILVTLQSLVVAPFGQNYVRSISLLRLTEDYNAAHLFFIILLCCFINASALVIFKLTSRDVDGFILCGGLFLIFSSLVNSIVMIVNERSDIMRRVRIVTVDVLLKLILPVLLFYCVEDFTGELYIFGMFLASFVSCLFALMLMHISVEINSLGDRWLAYLKDLSLHARSFVIPQGVFLGGAALIIYLERFVFDIAGSSSKEVGHFIIFSQIFVGIYQVFSSSVGLVLQPVLNRKFGSNDKDLEVFSYPIFKRIFFVSMLVFLGGTLFLVFIDSFFLKTYYIIDSLSIFLVYSLSLMFYYFSLVFAGFNHSRGLIFYSAFAIVVALLVKLLFIVGFLVSDFSVLKSVALASLISSVLLLVLLYFSANNRKVMF